MALPRCLLVDPFSIGVYHCVSRCVRRESLLQDPSRARWIVARLDALRRAFAIDICDFAVMGNHLHLLLRLLTELAMAWSDEEVARRWMTLCPPRLLRNRAGTGNTDDPYGPPTDLEIAIAVSDSERIEEWRARLADLGWFHKLLKEPCALIWNSADCVKGHFWEGRYHSVACPDSDALLAAATYILLNPVHCGAESELTNNPRTSMGARLRALQDDLANGAHAEGVETYRRALLEPAMPCIRGGVAALSGAEYVQRVADAARRRGLREEAVVAAREQLDEATRFADASREREAETEAAGVGVRDQHAGSELKKRHSVTGGSGAAASAARRPDERARFLRWRSPLVAHMRQRLKSRAVNSSPPDSIHGHRNPWRDVGGVPLLEGLTLEAFVEHVDSLGRVRRDDKPGFIAMGAPRVVERLRYEVVLDVGARFARDPPT